MSNHLNLKGAGALLTAHEIRLIRATNGWLVSEGPRLGPPDTDKPFFCFQSTAELTKHLAAMIGESKWTVCEQPRDGKGKFISPEPTNCQP